MLTLYLNVCHSIILYTCVCYVYTEYDNNNPNPKKQIEQPTPNQIQDQIQAQHQKKINSLVGGIKKVSTSQFTQWLSIGE